MTSDDLQDAIVLLLSVVNLYRSTPWVPKRKKITIPSSDVPGNYDEITLKLHLQTYLAKTKVTNVRIRTILLPFLLQKGKISRTELKVEFQSRVSEDEAGKVGFYMTLISGQLGREGNDFLRQVIAYDYPNHSWEKDNFELRTEYRDLVVGVLKEIGETLQS